MMMMMRRALVLAVALRAGWVVGGSPPSWPQSWALANSTAIYACNYSGLLEPSFIKQFAFVQLDWSNGKDIWANQHPMDAESLLVAQAAAIKAERPDTIVQVYRNTVKALSWFSSVRDKLVDPAYSGWFLHFGIPSPSTPRCDTAYSPPLCTDLYHDQMQTPQHLPPTGHGQNGTCWPQPCDCGGVPVGEYLWDLRNASARAFLIEDLLGPTALGNPNISGLYLDDYWSATQQPINPGGNQPPWGYCDHAPTGGPSEIQFQCIADMSLSQSDVNALYSGWSYSYSTILDAMDDAGAFAYQSFSFVSTPGPANIAGVLRSACSAGNTSSLYNAPLMHILTTPPECCPPNGNTTLLQFDQDVAFFMLVRGPTAWIGYGWEWCAETYEMPPALFLDYGDPLGTCSETSHGVFVRYFAHGIATFDTNTYTGSLNLTTTASRL